MGQASPLSATEYVLIQPQTNLAESSTPENIALLQREVILRAQGEAVELFDGLLPLSTILTFAAIYDIADEAVFRLLDGRLVLLFDHQPKGTMRSEEVDEIIWAEILKVKSKGVTVQDICGPKSEVIIDLASIWSRVRENDDIIARTKVFIKALFGFLEPAVIVRLRGEIPNLPLISAVYLVRPYGHRVIFDDARGNSVNIFSNI
ncbi:hypothetical protein KKC32_01270 [Patescibacteria group bacterium]|nr:hypothetical protein [Patescibacteria group bacterium]